MKRLGISLVVTVLACGHGSAGTTTGSLSSVSGHVVASPCRPVERSGDPPCPPVAGVTVGFGTITAVTDSTGTYVVNLPPGTYPIKIKAGNWERPATPASVTVKSGDTIILNLTYDSGIR